VYLVSFFTKQLDLLILYTFPGFGEIRFSKMGGHRHVTDCIHVTLSRHFVDRLSFADWHFANWWLKKWHIF